jgi:hypothetical protein
MAADLHSHGDRGATPGVEREMVGQLGHFAANAVESRIVAALVESLVDPGGNLAHLRLLHAAGGERRRAHANSGGLEGWVGVVGDGILVHRDAGLSQRQFGLRAEDALLENIDQHEVIVCSSGNDAEAGLLQGLSQHLGVGYDLRGVGLELRTEGFAKRDCLGCHDVHQRTALLAGKNGFVDRRGQVLAADDHAGAGATQRLVRSGGGDVGLGHG